MTDNEIFKALECCEANGGNSPDCKECPYFWLEEEPVDCHKRARRQVLDLIYRKNAEIESLQKMKQLTKAEAVKEFAERLKDKMFCEDFLLCEPCDMAEIIDSLVKEMVGDE